MDISNLGQNDDVFTVLKIFADADCRESLHWWFETEGEIKLFAICSDTFAWATADVEEITTDSIPVLKRAFDDLSEIGHMATNWMPELYAARVRKMRPQRPVYDLIRKTFTDGMADKIIELFEACGPERKD